MIRFCVQRVTYQANGERITVSTTHDAVVPGLQALLGEVRTEEGEIVEYSKLVWAELLAANGEPAMWRTAKVASKRHAP